MTQNLHEWMVWQIHFYCCCWGQNICQKCFEIESNKRLSRFFSLFWAPHGYSWMNGLGKKKSKSFKSLSLLFLGSKKVSGMLHRRRMSSYESSKRLSRSQSAKRYRKKSIKGLVLTVPPISGWARPKIQQTKMLVTCQRFGDLFLFGLIWLYSSNHKTYNKGRFKVIATDL